MKAVLITGATRRIGAELARSLAADGWAVALHHRDAESRAEAEALAEELGGGAACVAADLAVEAETQTLVERAARALGQPLTALVNNASTFDYDSVESATRQSWDFHMEANLRAPFVLTQHFAAQFPATEEQGGSVINLIDQRVWALTPHFVTYTLSKAGLWTLTQTLALALAPRIRVNAIGPGPALPSARQSQAAFDQQCAATPLGRGTDPAEIAAAVRFLLAAPAVTGQMIALDGGQHLGWAVPPPDAPVPTE